MEIYNHPELQKYVQNCPAGFAILTEGDRAEALYILLDGRLDVIKGGKKIHEINSPGSFFGEISFLLGTVRIASVIAASKDTRFLCLPNEEVERIWRRFPEFARQLAQNLARRLHETTNVAQGFRQFCDQMPDAVVMTDAAHKVLSWNHAAENLYGRSWRQMKGNTIEDIYDNQAAFHRFMADLETKDAVREKILKVNHPEKDWFFVSTSTTVLKDPHDNIQGYLFLSRDATSVRKLEKKHRLVRKWLLPLFLVLTLLTGWLCWRQLTLLPSATTASIKNQESRLLDRYNRDFAALELALLPALTAKEAAIADRVISDYFNLFHPELYGIVGVSIIGEDGRFFCSYQPTLQDAREIIDRPYEGVEFSGNGSDLDRNFKIYLVSRPESSGGEGVDIVVPIMEEPVRLAFHLDMKLIENKFGLGVNNLASTPEQATR